MNIAVKRLLAGFLRTGINVLERFPDPFGKNRPLTEAEIAVRENPSRPHLPRSLTSLNYRIPKSDLRRIFQLGTEYYYNWDADGVKVRSMVGEIPVMMDAIHGHGHTSVWHRPKAFDLYVNIQQGSPLSHPRGMLRAARNTLKHIPTVLIHAKNLVGIGKEAAKLEMPGAVCSLILVGRTTIDHATPRIPFYGLNATHLNGADNETVILHDVFKPVADPETGKITRMEPIKKSQPDHQIEVLRTLIFCKFVTDQMRDKNSAPDLKRCFDAARKLDLTAQSKLKDYLTLSLPEPTQP